MNVGRLGLLAKANSPTLLFGAGIVGIVGSTVLACRATLRIEEVLEETQSNLKKVKRVTESDALEHRDYTERDKQKDTSIIYVRATVRIARLYGPAVIVGGLSIAALTRSHSILTKRNAALMSAYAALEKGFDEYRARVVDKYGAEEDRHLRYGSEKVQILDEETGKKKTIVRVPRTTPSIYARFFDESCPSWNTNGEYNLIFLNCQQKYANDLLNSRGHVFLNEVYDMLGTPRSTAGSVTGWLKTEDGSTVNFVDFGIYDEDHVVRDFVNGAEGSILLDFNLDGVIYDKIDTPREAASWKQLEE